MKETTEKVFPIIAKYTERTKELDSDLYRILMFIIDKRKQSLLLRPFLTRLSFEICGGNNLETILPACAVSELLNISSYQANVAFDNKLGILSLNDKNSQFIASIITRELCTDILSEEEIDIDRELVSNITNLISKSNKFIYVAQHYDLNVLTTDNLNKYANDENLFMEDYIKRCFYGSGIFNGDCTQIGALLSGAKYDQIEALRSFGENYGIGLQIMNDLADFIPPGNDNIIHRYLQDQFSDLRNGRLTLSLYKILKTRKAITNRLLEKITNKEQFTAKELDEITRMLVEEGIVDSVKSLATNYAKKANASLDIFPDSDSKKFLSAMTSIFYGNKYLKCFSEITEKCNNYTKAAVSF
jgi:geranylgeranyl pyrophosphate synthase